MEILSFQMSVKFISSENFINIETFSKKIFLSQFSEFEGTNQVIKGQNLSLSIKSSVFRRKSDLTIILKSNSQAEHSETSPTS